MKAALIGAVDFNEAHFKSMAFDLVVAVDAGWQSCKDAGVVPSIVVGDFDSLGFTPADIPVLQYPCEKNESDMELACTYALDQGAHELYLYGALSGRLDHTLANLQLMFASAARGADVFTIGDDLAITALVAGAFTQVAKTTASASDPVTCAAPTRPTSIHPAGPCTLNFTSFDPATLTGSYAPYLSIFALGQPAQGLSIQGLKYEVSHFSLGTFSSRGLSNQFVGTPASIQLQTGALVVTMPLDALQYARLSHGRLPA